MEFDEIKEIGIDTLARLYIVPTTEQFHNIWLSATEVHWDVEIKALYSPKPREWSYYKWYDHILNVATEYGCSLALTDNTIWTNIPNGLKEEIVRHDINLRSKDK